MKKMISVYMALLLICSFVFNSIGMVAANNVSELDGSIILSRPTNTTITASITTNIDMSVFVEWGASSNAYSYKSEVYNSSTLNPAVIVMDKLTGNSEFFYRVNFKKATDLNYTKTQEYSFNTPRAKGNDYSFVVQSDSHLYNRADEELYKKSLSNMAIYNPDFIFDLGDAFINDASGSNDKTPDVSVITSEQVRESYVQQLPYLGIVANNAPLFLTLGNHESEYGNFLDGTDENFAIMSTQLRKTYFPNPVPNEFYSGNTQQEEFVGNPENYYAFEWGDALYVSIDMYRYTTKEPYAELKAWDWTLGETQYKWFKETLENSNAKYKFVFSHHAIGNIRGGKTISNLFEWGGYNRLGEYLFDVQRPGWGKPIQQIMKDTGVTIFFQGHDHLFAMENVDGVIYQTIPKPAESVKDPESNSDEYADSDKLVNSGFLKIDVTSGNVKVDFWRNYCMLTDADQRADTGVAYSYTVDENHNVNYIKQTSDDFEKYGTPLNIVAYNDLQAPTPLNDLPYPIVDTGVTTFYSNLGVISMPSPSDAYYGQDANYQENMPSYTNNNDGTITDNVTGLMWQQDMGEKITYDEAFTKAAELNLAGYTDWRFPTIKELYSLIQYTGQSGGEKAIKSFIDTNYFIQPIGDTTIGEREIDAQTWSATKYVGKTMNKDETIFGVNFIDGRIKGYPQYKASTQTANKMYTRMVRGNTEYGKNNFIDNGDGTISDFATGLMWQKEDDGTSRDWQQSLKYAQDLELAGYTDWKLPSSKELQSIVDYSRSPQTTNSAAIDPKFICSEIIDPNGKVNYPFYWSSTTHLDGSNPYSNGAYVAFGEAQGKMNNIVMDVHGAGAQRSDPKSGNASDYPQYFGPQGDVRYVYNYSRCVRSITENNYSISCDVNSNTVSISAPSACSSVLIIANYDENKKLIAIKTLNVNLTQGQNDFSTNLSTSKFVKVLLWGSITSMNPLCDSWYN